MTEETYKTDDKIKAVVIGLGETGSAILHVLNEIEGVELVGVCDTDTLLAKDAGEKFSAAIFSDSRSAIVEAKPNLAFIASPPQTWKEIIPLCAEEGISVWKKTPLGRNLGEAAAFVRQMDRAGVLFAIDSSHDFPGNFPDCLHLTERVSNPFLACATRIYRESEPLGWRANAELSGGGVTLQMGFSAAASIVKTLGIPNEVFSVRASENSLPVNGSPTDTTQHYDTEDTCVIVLRYGQRCAGQITVSRASGPSVNEFTLRGTDGSVVINDTKCTLNGISKISGTDGEDIENIDSAFEPSKIIEEQIRDFINSVRDKQNCYNSSARENLLTQAVIEAAYLSHQTGQPDSPHELLRTHGFSVEYCMEIRPKK